MTSISLLDPNVARYVCYICLCNVCLNLVNISVTFYAVLNLTKRFGSI